MTHSTGCLRLFRYVMGFLVFVLLPAIITVVQPISRVSFKRERGRILARTHILLLFVVPFRPRAIDSVVAIDQRDIASTVVRTRGGKDSYTEAQGFLVIEGEQQTIEVPVSPAKLEEVTGRARAFLSDPQATELKMTLVTSRMFSAIGAAISLLSVFWVMGVAVTLSRALGWIGPPKPNPYFEFKI